MRAQEINGSFSENKDLYPPSTGVHRFHWKLPWYKNFSFAIVAKLFYGEGFLYGDFARGYTTDGRKTE